MKLKKKKLNFKYGIIHIQSTFNNTIITGTGVNGDIILTSSGGEFFKGARKSTPFAAQLVGEKVSQELAALGIQAVEVRLTGAGAGRETSLRAIHGSQLILLRVHDLTKIPHNGCRPPKKRRI